MAPDASIERRLAVLEENLRALRDEMDAKVQDLRKRMASIKEQAERESREREVEDQKMAAKIEEVAVGGLHLETIGLLWLVFGVIGTSIPEEIAALIRRIL